MENLNNLIWTDEDDDNGNDIQLQGEGDMKERCLVAFCVISTPNGPAGNLLACGPGISPHPTMGCI